MKSVLLPALLSITLFVPAQAATNSQQLVNAPQSTAAARAHFDGFEIKSIATSPDRVPGTIDFGNSGPWISAIIHSTEGTGGATLLPINGGSKRTANSPIGKATAQTSGFLESTTLTLQTVHDGTTSANAFADWHIWEWYQMPAYTELQISGRLTASLESSLVHGLPIDGGMSASIMIGDNTYESSLSFLDGPQSLNDEVSFTLRNSGGTPFWFPWIMNIRVNAEFPAAGAPTSPVPEPGTWVMLGGGLVLVCTAARRRRLA